MIYTLIGNKNLNLFNFDFLYFILINIFSWVDLKDLNCYQLIIEYQSKKCREKICNPPTEDLQDAHPNIWSKYMEEMNISEKRAKFEKENSNKGTWKTNANDRQALHKRVEEIQAETRSFEKSALPSTITPDSIFASLNNKPITSNSSITIVKLKDIIADTDIVPFEVQASTTKGSKKRRKAKTSAKKRIKLSTEATNSCVVEPLKIPF